MSIGEIIAWDKAGTMPVDARGRFVELLNGVRGEWEEALACTLEGTIRGNSTERLKENSNMVIDEVDQVIDQLTRASGP